MMRDSNLVWLEERILVKPKTSSPSTEDQEKTIWTAAVATAENAKEKAEKSVKEKPEKIAKEKAEKSVKEKPEKSVKEKPEKSVKERAEDIVQVTKSKINAQNSHQKSGGNNGTSDIRNIGFIQSISTNNTDKNGKGGNGLTPQG